jgi:glycosyltransferase involved in cell wall biosynthesis
VNILLVGNYADDGQESMRRFAELLAQQLPRRGIGAQILCPSSFFGRLPFGSGALGKWLGYLDKFLIFPRTLRSRLHQLGPDSLVHICDHSNAVYTRILRTVPHLVTCHDLLAVRAARGEFPQCRTRATGKLYQAWILRGLNSAGKVACVSNATSRDLLRLSNLAPRQITKVHNGLNYPYAPLTKLEAATRLQKAQPRLAAGFILHVGGNQWYKNRAGVLQIYTRLCEKISSPPVLVMAGKPLTRPLRLMISRNGLEQRVLELNTVGNEDLRTLYCSAGLLLFPSCEEGFGWPIVEAQACGCPVVIAKREPMAEIGGDAAVQFEFESGGEFVNSPLSARSADAAAEAVKATLLETDAGRLYRAQRGIRNSARFATARMIDEYVKLYQELLGAETAPIPQQEQNAPAHRSTAVCPA